MLYALTAGQMRGVEDEAVARGAATVSGLMNRAGQALAAEVERRVPAGPVVVVCGPGNNGGDGWVAARILHEAGRDVRVVSSAADPQPEAASAARAAQSAGVSWTSLDEHGTSLAEIAAASTIIDALFGFGFRGPAREPYASAIGAIASADAIVVSADVPSGVDADTGGVLGTAVRAAVTVTFSAPKPGLFIYPGALHAGEVLVADVGVPADMLDLPGALELPTASDLKGVFPLCSPGDHKGSRGRVAIVAGSLTYPGAAVLAAQGALRLGAGFVVAVVPEPIADILRVSLPGILVRPVPATPEGALATAASVLQAVADADAVVVGPGLTTGQGVADVVRALVAKIEVPLLLDADALNVMSGSPALLISRSAPLLITPHPGEMARLTGSASALVQADRVAAASALGDAGPVCVLKGPHTIVAGCGRRALVRAGNAGLARAGSGDVLAGMLGTLLAQGLAPFDAAVLGAYLHGRAAEYGTQLLTETCFTSDDIATFLPDAVREVLGG